MLDIFTLETWTKLMFASLFVTALAAAAVWITTYATSRLQDEKAKTADEALERYKADASKEIAGANKVAGEARERAATLEKQAEQLRADNLELERSISPRRWYGPLAASHIGAPTAEALFSLLELNSKLAQFSKTPVLIQAIPDFEAQKLASEMIVALTFAGWSPELIGIDRSNIPAQRIPDGVQIWTRSERDKSWDAAEALAASFKNEGIRAEEGTQLHQTDPSAYTFPSEQDIRLSIPPGHLLILIGAKPGFQALQEKLGSAYKRAHPDEK